MKKQELSYEIEYIESKPLRKKERENLSTLIVKNKAENKSKK